MSLDAYLGNPNLKKANVHTNFTPKQVKEFIKCAEGSYLLYQEVY